MLLPYPRVFLTTPDGNVMTEGSESMQTLVFQRTPFPNFKPGKDMFKMFQCTGWEDRQWSQLGRAEKW